MNNFDFSMYDYSDVATKEEKQKAEEVKKAKHDPFFDSYDYGEEETSSSNNPNNEQNSSEPYAKGIPPWLEKAQKLSFKEKAQELIPFGKGIASGATLGYSEKIPGLETEEGNELEAGGKFVGAALPITKAAKVADWVLTKVPKVLQPLRFLMHGGITGAVYESAVQGAKASRGEEVDLSQVPKTARDFAIFTQALGIGGQLAERFQKSPKTAQADVIEKGIIPENLTKSQYETADEMLKNVNKNRKPPDDDGGLPPPPPPGAPPGPPPPPIITRRFTPGQDIGLRPVTIPETPDLRNTVGDIFSRNRFYNTTQGGQALKNEIMSIDQDVYRGVNDLYKTSRELHSEINQIHPQLIGQLENRLAPLKQIPEPSDVQRRVIKTGENILKDLRTVDEEGHLTGYLDINNQTLIDQIQSLRQIVDYDFAHGDTKNIFRPLIDDIQDAVIGAAEVADNIEAVDSFADARAGYKTWKQYFDNEYVRPFRDASNQDFSKLYKSSQDFDEHNMLRNVLNLSDRGQELMNASTRDIVEKNLSKFFDNPRGTNLREFNTALRELEAIIQPEQAQEIRTAFNEAKRRPNIIAKKSEKKPPIEEEKYKEPEDILKEMNTRSGIKRIKKKFSDTKENKDLFEELSQKKMRSVLREGNIDKNSTGNDYAKVLNKEKNYELFSEFLGEKKTEELRLLAKEIGDQEVKELSKAEAKKKLTERIGKKVIDVRLIEILLNLF